MRVEPAQIEGVYIVTPVDARRITQELGWKPVYTFDEGLKEYLA